MLTPICCVYDIFGLKLLFLQRLKPVLNYLIPLKRNKLINERLQFSVFSATIKKIITLQ